MVSTAVTLEVWNAVNSTFHDKEKFSEIFSGAVEAGIRRAKELSMD